MGCLHNCILARKDFPSLKLSGQYMADNVNDKGDSRTIQEIVRAVVADLRVVFCKIRYRNDSFNEASRGRHVGELKEVYYN